MWGAIVDIHHRVQYIYIGERVMASEITPYLGFQGSIETLHSGGLGVIIFSGKVMNFVSFQPLLKFVVEEFRSLVRLHHFRKGMADRLESIHEGCARFVFERYFPAITSIHVKRNLVPRLYRPILDTFIRSACHFWLGPTMIVFLCRNL